jgi:cell division protein FtsN
LRLKDRQHFRVVLGTYDFSDNAKAFAEKVTKMGAKVTINEVGDKFKVQAGYFDGRVNAEALQDTLTKKGIISVIEVV